MASPIERVLEALNQADVKYLVVGGVAVVLHGHLRTTADLDLVVRLDRDNVLRAIAALTDLGYQPRTPIDPVSLADPSFRERLVEEKGLTVFSFWNPNEPAAEVDLFAREPFDFDDVHGRALRVPLDDAEAVLIGLDDLIALKLAANRPRDLDDVEALRALRDAGKPQDGPPHD